MSEFQRLMPVLYSTAANQSPEEETKTRSCSKYFLFAVIEVLSCTHRTQRKTLLKELDFVLKFCFILHAKPLTSVTKM